MANVGHGRPSISKVHYPNSKLNLTTIMPSIALLDLALLKLRQAPPLQLVPSSLYEQ